MRQGAWSSPPTLAALLALLALLVLPLVLAPRADAYIYWTNPGAIGRADLDGSGVDQSFVPDVPCCLSDVAVDADHLYWAHSYEGTAAIGRANLDGTGVDQSFIRDVPGAWSISGIAVGPEYLYWLSFPPGECPCIPTIGRARLDGTQVDPSFIGGLPGNPGRIAVDAAHLYWTAHTFPTGTIGRANLDGTGVDQSFVPTGNAPVGIAVDGRYLYWADSSGGIGRARVDGSEIDQGFIAGGNLALAVDAAHIYFSDRGYRSSTIRRANIDGTGAGAFLFTAPQGLGVPGLAVDGLGISQLQGTASAKENQRQQGKKVVFKVKVSAEEQLTANATGTMTVNSTYKLKPRSVEVAGDDTETLKLKPKKANAKKIAAALKRGAKANARLKVTLIDVAGNSAIAELRVRLKR